jgi:hypothetical protein
MISTRRGRGITRHHGGKLQTVIEDPAAVKIPGARAESKRLATKSAIFVLGGAPTAHEP